MRYGCKALCIGVPSALQLDSIFGHYSYEWNAEARYALSVIKGTLPGL